MQNLLNLRENIKNAIIKPNAIDIDNRLTQILLKKNPENNFGILFI